MAHPSLGCAAGLRARLASRFPAIPAGDASDPSGDGLHSASDGLTPVGIMPDPDGDGLPENGKMPVFGQK